MPLVNDYDFVIVGGGLQGCLILHALQYRRPRSRVLLVEKNDTLCGNRTWSFHRTDLSNDTYCWFKNLVDCSWSSYDVRIGPMNHRVKIPYGSIRSDSLTTRTNRLLDRAPNFVQLRGNVVNLSPDRLELDNKTEITGRCVLDARGIEPATQTTRGCGYQKFLGLEVELNSDWLSHCPTLMDDSVDQSDGFRFIYSLPFSSRRVLIEDTTFSTHADFCQRESTRVIDQYLKRQGHRRYQIIRRESGCLPMPYVRQKNIAPTAVGYRGGFFHPATGYSIPLAANLADRIAAAVPQRSVNVIAEFRKQNRFQNKASLWLNRMLFQLVKPQHRSEIFQRFYNKLPPSSIGRFYAHDFTANDIAKLLIGRPPTGLTPIRFLKSFGEKPCPAL